MRPNRVAWLCLLLAVFVAVSGTIAPALLPAGPSLLAPTPILLGRDVAEAPGVASTALASVASRAPPLS